jgi:hypothetical protein
LRGVLVEKKSRLPNVRAVQQWRTVDRDRIIAQLDAEIARLTAARDALTGSNNTRKTRRTGRVWSAAARARQSRAMKARWAKRKKA